MQDSESSIPQQGTDDDAEDTSPPGDNQFDQLIPHYNLSGDVPTPSQADSTPQGVSGQAPVPDGTGQAPPSSETSTGQASSPQADSINSPQASEHEDHVARDIRGAGESPTDADPPQEEKGRYKAVFYLEVEKIVPNPHQPRRNFDEEGIKGLAASIQEFGILQPLVVRRIEHDVPSGTAVDYELIAGERRLLAAKLAGLTSVPAIVRSVGSEREKLELAIIENIQREDLNPIEMARAFSRLQDEFRSTQREIAVRVGKSRETVANTLRLLDLPTEIQQAIEKRQITESHGRLLLTVSDPAMQQKLFRDVLERGFTTRELKSSLEGVVSPPPQRRKATISPELEAIQEQLSLNLGAPVSIKHSGRSGKITISFYSGEELRGILDRLSGGENE